MWSGEKFRNVDVDRPVDEMEIENLDQQLVWPGWADQCGGRGRGSSSAEARNTSELTLH